MTEHNHTCSLTREEFLDSFVQLYHAIKDYEELLDLFADETRPDPALITKALKDRISKLQFDGANSKSMEMIGAYIRFTLESFKGSKLNFTIPDAPGDAFFKVNTGLVPLADEIQKAEQGLADLQDKVFYLTRLLPPKNTERIRLLLKAVASLFKAIVRRDFGDLENHLSHIHHLTANKESFFLVNEIGRMVRDVNLVEDIAQETFIRAYRALHQFRGDAQFYTWLYRIAVNTAKKALMELKRDPTVSENSFKSGQSDESDETSPLENELLIFP